MLVNRVVVRLNDYFEKLRKVPTKRSVTESFVSKTVRSLLVYLKKNSITCDFERALLGFSEKLLFRITLSAALKLFA